MSFEWVLIYFLLLVVSYLSYKYFRQIHQVNEIRRVIKAMTQGDYSSRMSLSPKDHLGDVARNVQELGLGIRKRLDELAVEQEKLDTILSNMAEGVLVISAENMVIHLSPSFQMMFDIRTPEWRNKHYWEVITNQIIIESIRDVIKSQKVLRKEISIMNIKEMYFHMQISPVFDLNEKLISLVAVFHDVSELKKFERLRTEFVANVSHELKTPLTSIKGFVETLKDGAIEDKSHALRFLDIILKQTTRLENLVNDLLILSSLESQNIKMNFVKTDVIAVLQSVIDLKRKQIDEFGHVLIVDLPNKIPLIMVDVLRIEQVLLNLIDNAIKFTHKGGKIHIKSIIDGAYLRIDVSDNGPGISIEYQQRIFERFFRVDKSRSQETGGTGLGLSIVKHIVEAHQGKITLQSALGSGSTFSVYLKIDMV